LYWEVLAVNLAGYSVVLSLRLSTTFEVPAAEQRQNAASSATAAAAAAATDAAKHPSISIRLTSLRCGGGGVVRALEIRQRRPGLADGARDLLLTIGSATSPCRRGPVCSLASRQSTSHLAADGPTRRTDN